MRGARNATIVDKKYDTLKTHGIGNDISWKDWQQYIIQLINQGYCEISFHKNNALQLTEFSKKVLFERELVNLTKPAIVTEKVTKKKAVKKTEFKHTV